ncbi:MAG: aspartyl/asparaginyl beta-hydroxylase domain-containing protein [Bacteroidota bacterium]|nr:aspartyl/asparaginyl beta-hydroxylase domain-containing protein [Bacteroidota bacterium]
MIKHIKFHQQFDAARLQQEVARLETAVWREHYNRRSYEGNWSTLQLRSLHGQLDNNAAVPVGTTPGENPFRDTELLAQCPYHREVIDFFRMEKNSVRLMKLDAGAIIRPHHDHNLNYEQGEVRLHIPVITNPQLEFYLEAERLRMAEGSCWYLNLSLEHQVINAGPTPRVHLVIDGLVNDWLRAYFHKAQHHSVTMAAPQLPPPSREDQLLIIAQLRRLQTATADKLADEMQAGMPSVQ